VIAIENARLFNDTKEALEQQRVISEILQAISHSPTDTQPVFDAIVKSGVHLFGGLDMTLRLVRGDYHERVASTLNYPPGTSQSEHRIPVNDLRRAQSRAIFNREVVQTPDILDQEAGVEIEQRMSRPFRAHLIAPLMRDDQAIGVLGVFRATPGRFSEKEIALLQTFSSQAVIAIQNVRLFKELQARNADLTEALEQQTVTSEILRIISRSLTDTQPVFDAIVRNGVRLFDGMAVALRLVEGDTAVTVASTRPFGAVPSGAFSVRADDPRSPTARAMHTREIVQIQDFHAPEDWIDPNAIRRADERGFRALLSAPLLREHDSIGAINVTRATPGPFTEKHIALLKTFADQAVIAIENVRLFKELQSRNAEISEALEQQTVTAGILKIISGSPTDTQPVFDAIVRSGERLFDGATVSLRVVKGDNSVIVASTQPLVEAGSTVPLSLDDERRPAVRAIVRREVVHVPDFLTVDWVTEDAKERAEGRGFRAMLCAPMLREGQAVGTINLTRRTPGPFTDKQITILKTFADQAVIAIENVRLFNEIQEKSRQLEIANRHKSEFLANMSHELRTPLNAVIGFSEVLQQGMVGALNEKQGEYINNIHTSGSHLLSLINDILDLSKVEAGRMELDLTCFSVPLAIDNALTLVKERATRHGLNIESTLDPAVAEIHADERKFKQVMLNLLSNAVKFTPEGGSITVAAREVDGMMEVSVTDTGIGIAPEDCEAVFEEFRQVGQDAERKAQGTGLGLALTRKFIELHGGKIWLTSTVGKGSTFYFTLPIAQLELQATA
jgi:signal transduction histidine kinase